MWGTRCEVDFDVALELGLEFALEFAPELAFAFDFEAALIRRGYRPPSGSWALFVSWCSSGG